MRQLLLALIVLLATSFSAPAQNIQPLLQTGDVVSGVPVTKVYPNPIPVQVSDSGDWLALVNFSGTSGAVVVNGVVTVEVGGPPPGPAPPNAWVTGIPSAHMHRDGRVTYVVQLSYSAYSMFQPRSAIYVDSNPVAFADTPALSSVWDDEAEYFTLTYAKLVNDGAAMLVSGSVRQPSTGSSPQSFLAFWPLDSAYNVLSESLIAWRSSFLPGVAPPGAVDQFNNQFALWGVSDTGQSSFVARMITPTGSVWGLWKNIGGGSAGNSLLALPGNFEPQLGGVISVQGQRSSDINDSGSTVMLLGVEVGGMLKGGVYKDGVLFVATGDPHPAFPGEEIVSLGQNVARGPLRIAANGDVFWSALSNTSGKIALLRNFEPLVVEGQTLIAGSPVQRLGRGESSMGISRNGRWMIFVEDRVNSSAPQTVHLMDLDPPFADLCFGDGGDQMGCTDCPCMNNAPAGSGGGCLNSNGTSASLNASGTASVASDSLRFEVSSATLSTFGILQSADNQLPNVGPCLPGSGIVSPGILDGLRCVGGAALRHGTRATDTNGDIGVTNNGWGLGSGPAGGLIAANGFTAGQTRHFQCFYREDALLGCQTGQNTTNAVSVTFAP